MPSRVGLTLGTLLVLSCFALGAAGLVLIGRSVSMPEYVNQTRAEAHRGTYPPSLKSEDLDEFTAEWVRKLDELRTPKWMLYETGRGLLTLSFCVLAAVAWFNLSDIRNMGQIKSPRSLGRLLAILLTAWLSLIPSIDLLFREELSRRSYPWWADTIAITIFTNSILILVLSPFLLLISWLLLRRSRFPVGLWAWNSNRRGWSFFWTFVFGGLCVLMLLIVFEAVASGPFTFVPIAFVAMYVALSARAALVQGEASA